jgi:protease-4
MRMKSTALAPMLVLTAGLAGCTANSLLITPVTSKRSLVETELRRDGLFAFDKIALIDVSGVIANSPRQQLLGGGEHPVSLLLEQLQRARRDRRVKAVILRINSPGGTVAASELMHDEIMNFRRVTGKPVYAVMMDVAASGAFYIACACDEILALRSTVTGSIGVIMQMFDVTGTMKLIGVQADAITSGRFKDAGSPLKEMTPEEREIFQSIVNDMYERFVGVVVAGRPGLSEAEVRRLADGRVYTSQQALDAGLIDRIATLREAVDLVKKDVGAKRIRLVAYQRPLDFRPNYYAESPAPQPVNLLNVQLPPDPAALAPRFLYVWIP